MSLIPPSTPRAARSSAPSQSQHSMSSSRGGGFTSARSRPSKIRCEGSLRASIEKTAGFSPDRVDALVWAMSDLLVEPMPAEGHFEYMRQLAASLKPAPPEPPKPVYAPGSLEYERQQAEK